MISIEAVGNAVGFCDQAQWLPWACGTVPHAMLQRTRGYRSRTIHGHIISCKNELPSSNREYACGSSTGPSPLQLSREVTRLVTLVTTNELQVCARSHSIHQFWVRSAWPWFVSSQPSQPLHLFIARFNDAKNSLSLGSSFTHHTVTYDAWSYSCLLTPSLCQGSS